MSLYSLRILGPPELTGRDGASIQSVLKQPKRTALLAYLAMAPSGTRTRSEIVALFWSDSTEEEGRHALSQALYYLRRSLSRSALMADGEVLGLDPAVVGTDIALFRSHLEGGRLREAVALVRGDLLEQLPGTPGVEQWLDGARETVRQQVLEALEQLSLDAEAAGDHDVAIRCAERGHALAPYHEAPMRRLLSSLIAGSQPVRAREVFERFTSLLRDDLETEPSPKTAAILETATPAAEAPEDAAATAVVDPATAAPDPGPALPARRSAAPAVSPVRPPGSRRRWALRILLPAAAVAVAFLGAFDRLGFSDPRPDLAAAPPENRVGVFPFMYRGHPELAYLGEGIPELITISIHGLDQVSTIDPRALAAGSGGVDAAALRVPEVASRARDLGAEHFVIGSVVEVGGQLHVTARLHRADDATPVAIVSGRAAAEEELFELVDDLVRQLVASKAFPGGSDLERSAALTSGSLPALRHFLRGERLFRAGRYQDAVSAFDHAVTEDSTFALALYRSAIASLWSAEADFEGARAKTARALLHRDRVSALEGELFLALHEFLRGRLLSAERLYESVLVRQPENIEAWFQLAETRFHYGPLHGRPAVASKDAWHRVLALNPEHHAALIHLSALAAVGGDPDLDSLELRINLQSDSLMPTPQVRALSAFSSGSEAARAAFLAQLERHPGRAVASTAAYASRYLRDPGAGARIARLLTVVSRPAADRAEGHLLLAHFALAEGRAAEALRELDRAQRLDSLRTEPHRLLMATLPTVPIKLRSQGGGMADAALRLETSGNAGSLATFDGSADAALKVYGHALAYHRGGGEDGALLTAARRLRSPVPDSGDATLLRSLAHGLTAERHLSNGDSAAAASDLATAISEMERWYEHLRADYLRSLARERFLLAETEIAAGRDASAESLLTPFGDNSVAELPYLGASLLRIGEIRERAGDAAGAADAYRQALALWSRAEPPLDTVRAELAARIIVLTG